MSHPFTGPSRQDELYCKGMEKYNEVLDLDLGINNALIAAVAVMIADSESTRVWKTPALIGDPQYTAWEDQPTVDLGPRDGAVVTRQLELGDW